MDGWMDEWVNRLVDGSIDVLIYGCVLNYLTGQYLSEQGCRKDKYQTETLVSLIAS